MILCKETEKYYIGKTKRELTTRFNEHIAKSREENSPAYKSPLSRAIRKYTKIAFDIALIADNIPDKDFDIVEAHYIDMYNSTNQHIGYNVSSGENNSSKGNRIEDVEITDDPEVNINIEKEFNEILGEIDEI